VRDVARRAGVSPSLVSRVLRGQERYAAPDTRSAIRRAAAELSYRPNVLAQHLRTGRTAVVGVLFHRLVDYRVYVPILTGIEEGLRLAGYSMLVAGGDTPDQEAEALRLFRSQQVAGVVLISSLRKMPSRHLATAARDGLPLVAINRWLEEDGDTLAPAGGPVPRVLWDNAGGARVLASRLIAMGHTRLAAVTDQTIDDAMPSVGYRQRWTALRETAAAAGRPAPLALRVPDVAAGAWRGAGITAFLGLTDRTAADTLHALAGLGLAVPRDASVTGFTDTELAAHLTPRLTTAQLPFEESGRAAVRTLLRLLQGDAVEAVTVLPRPVMERESWAPVNSPPAPAG
jgi:DNA-binding LacI/PurR family transcriptional regulator